MCDYSMHEVATRLARVGDRLLTRMFNSSTRGFAAAEDAFIAVCVLPGNELSFDEQVKHHPALPNKERVIRHRTAIFRKINRKTPIGHRDALEFPTGELVLLNALEEGQSAVVLQCPPIRSQPFAYSTPAVRLAT